MYITRVPASCHTLPFPLLPVCTHKPHSTECHGFPTAVWLSADWAGAPGAVRQLAGEGEREGTETATDPEEHEVL